MSMRDEMAEFDDVEGLLPWYASGGLAPAEVERVEKALAEMPDLRRRYRVVLEERSAVIGLNESLGAPPPDIMAKVFARIENGQAQARPRRRINFGEWLTGWLPHWQPHSFALAGLAAALVAMVEAGLLASMMLRGPQPGVIYETDFGPVNATGQEGAADGAGSASRGINNRPGTFVIVALRPEATAAQIEGFLDRYHASIVDGPKPGGFYRIRVSDKVLAPDEVRSIAAAMRKEGAIVRLVTPNH